MIDGRWLAGRLEATPGVASGGQTQLGQLQLSRPS